MVVIITQGGSIYGGGGGGGAGAAGADGAMPNSSGAGGNGQPFPQFAAPLISPDIPSPDRSDWTSDRTYRIVWRWWRWFWIN